MKIYGNEELNRAVPAFAELTADLLNCGWSKAPLNTLSEELFFQTFQGPQRAPCARFANASGRHLLLIALENITLHTRQELFPKFLNLSLEERMALSAASLIGQSEWLLLLTAGRLDLYRLADETCEYQVAAPAEYEKEFLPALAAFGRGREQGLRSGTHHLPDAESLRGWLKHWSLQLASGLEVSPADIELLLWKWILMLQVPRRTQKSEAAGGWGLQCVQLGDVWTISYDALSAGTDLRRALENFDQNFLTRLFAGTTDIHLYWLDKMEESGVVERLRAELLMQTQNRFASETVAWLYTDLAREQDGWRREVAGLEPVRKVLQHDGWNIFAPLTCDMAGHGLTAALRDADRLGQYLNDVNQYSKDRLARPGTVTNQPDLFCQNPRGIGPQGSLDDGLNFMFGETLRLGGVKKEEMAGVGIVFLLKALELTEQLEWPFLGIDTLDKLLGLHNSGW